MNREPLSLTLPDVSTFARSLRAGLGDGAPSHQSLLNLIATAGGYRNHQHLRAVRLGAPPVEPVDGEALRRALARFDDQGRLLSWSTRRKIRALCLWPIWAALPPRTSMSERQVSAQIDALTVFRDAAQVRRSLVEDGRLSRKPDGSDYRRLERAPDATALALIRAVLARRPGTEATMTPNT